MTDKLDESQLTIGKIAYQILTAEGVTETAWAQFFKLLDDNALFGRFFWGVDRTDLRMCMYELIQEIKEQETAILTEAKKEPEPEPEQTYSVGDYFTFLHKCKAYKIFRLCYICDGYVTFACLNDAMCRGNCAGDDLTKVNDVKKITQEELNFITGAGQIDETAGYFKKITKSEAESIVGHALD